MQPFLGAGGVFSAWLTVRAMGPARGEFGAGHPTALSSGMTVSPLSSTAPRFLPGSPGLAAWCEGVASPKCRPVAHEVGAANSREGCSGGDKPCAPFGDVLGVPSPKEPPAPHRESSGASPSCQAEKTTTAISSLSLQHEQGRENQADAPGAPCLPKPNLPDGFKGDKDRGCNGCGCQQNKEVLGATVRVFWLL